MAGPPANLVSAGGFLVVDITHALLTKRAIVKPVVAHPAVDHGIHRYRHFERRVRIDECHKRQETVIGNAEDTDPAVGLRNVLNEPIYRVVGVCWMIHFCGVLWTTHGAIHYIFA